MSAPPPNVEQLLELACADSRIGLDEVRKRPRGQWREELSISVEPADADNKARLQLGDPMMMAELATVLEMDHTSSSQTGPLLLLCRRVNHFMNSMGQGLDALGSVRNPLAMHPDDMESLQIKAEQHVEVRSATGVVETHVVADDTLRRGVVSLSHGFGGLTGAESEGASIARLIGLDECDPVTGIPRMSAVQVSVSPVIERMQNRLPEQLRLQSPRVAFPQAISDTP